MNPRPALPRAANRALAYAEALFEELARAGLRHVCVCPGSRSTPLAVAAAQRPELRCWSHVDERAAGFFGLGLARASGRAAALVCTSGTAAANFLPAVVEAHYARVPLLVLTADRPPELREWGAGQTIDQTRLYGSHVRWFAEAPTPEASSALRRHARALACRALAAAEGAPPGPVHLNLPFREPLHPVAVEEDRRAALAEPLAADGRAGRPYTRLRDGSATPRPEDVAWLLELVRAHPRGAIVCGPLDAGADLAEAIVALGHATGWPVVAEGASQLRAGPWSSSVLAHADLFLRVPQLAAALRPDVVLRVGATPTSRAVRAWIEEPPPAHLVLLDTDAAWNDPAHLASEVLRSDPLALCDALLRRLGATPPAPAARAFAEPLREAERRTARVLEARVDACDELLSARAVRELRAALPERALLWVSNSLPVRDLDAFFGTTPARLRLLASRGASGIDGLVSSALGAAAAGAGPVVLLSGDLAFLHDAGGLLAARRHRLAATIVVLDNDGGGIFGRLPVAAFGDAVGFEDLFRTPHGLDLGPVAEAFGASATRVGSWEHFRAALKSSLEEPRTQLIVVPVDAERDTAQRRELEQAVRDALRDLPGGTP